MLESKLNLYDYIDFPNSEKRAILKNKYLAFSELKQISSNLLDKYDGKLVSYEFIDFETTVNTRINEYNYAIFVLNIPLYQMLYVYERIKHVDVKKEELPYYLCVFNYYSEILAYYIDWAFKKSVNIYNAAFEFNVNDGHGSFKRILDEMRKQAKNNKIIKKVNKKLINFRKNECYREIIKMRNHNTHSVRVTQFGFIDTYDPKTGITTGTVNIPMKSNEIVSVILGSIKLLGEYAEFIEGIIREYYDDLYEEYQKMDEDEIESDSSEV